MEITFLLHDVGTRQFFLSDIFSFRHHSGIFDMFSSTHPSFILSTNLKVMSLNWISVGKKKKKSMLALRQSTVAQQEETGVL